MARDFARPAGYRPLVEFNLRTQPEGGGVANPAQSIVMDTERGRRETLVLIHGFNNTEGEASNAYYLGFRKVQRGRLPETQAEALERFASDAFWPGDAKWWWVFDKADFLIYPKSVFNALDAAEQLVQVLLQLPSLHRVHFIAHSLGCRVTLQAMQLLYERTGLSVGRVCLMAPAVPSEFLEPGGQYHNLLLQLQAEGTEVLVLHSTEDVVLHYAFPPGQLLAGEGSTRALGRRGPSPQMPGLGGRLSGTQVHGAGHGDYWGHSESGPSKVATQAAATFLRLGDVTRDIAGRSLGAGLDAPPSRDWPTAREVGNSRGE